MHFFDSLVAIFSGRRDTPPRHDSLIPVFARMAEASDKGQRQTNEDYVLVAPDMDLAIVADGMGGHEAGEVASHLASEVIRDTLAASRPTDLRQAEAAILAAMVAANGAVHAKNQANLATGRMAMGTTVAGVWRPDRDARHVLLFNIGDSRVYLFRDGRLSQVSRDHTLYQNWLDGGERGPAPDSHYLTRCIGVAAEVEPMVGLCQVMQGDILLLCSDGLNAHVDDPTIGMVLGGGGDISTLCHSLVAHALAGGGSDNISIIAVQWGLSDQ
ncbi:MAG: protein phosphatase 2C domain-containing protein [Phaeospirillum sp.]|nr:protein phosphatase 2C domain-containing protein [Phaeospirillum sp.]